MPAALLGATVGATNLLFIKAAYQAGFTPLVFGALRFLCVAALAAAGLALTGTALVPRDPTTRRWLVREGMAKAIGALPIYLAVYLVPATVVLILSFASPLVQMLAAGRYLGDQVSGRRAAGVGVAISGLLVWVLLQDLLAPAASGAAPWGVPGVDRSAPATLLGMALALTGIASTSILAMIQKKAFRSGATALQSVYLSALIPGAVWAVLVAVYHGASAPVPGSAWAWAFFTYSCTVAGVGLFAYRRWLVARYHVSFLATFSPVSRILALGMAPLLLGEPLPLRALGALALVSLGASLAWPRGAGARGDAAFDLKAPVLVRVSR